VAEVENEYLLGPGDVIEILYHYTPKPAKTAYHLAVGDVINVEFQYHGYMTRKLTVRPDGKVSMPRIDDVKILGLTPLQVKEKLEKLYAHDFKNPMITVTMVKYNRAIERLRKAITTAPRGQSKLTTIRPDGYVSFPLISDIKAAGMSLPELKKIVTKEYNKFIDNLTVSLILKVMKANLVYVMGEVRKPGNYLMQHPITVTQAISMAGGFNDTSERSTVLVVTRDKKNRPVGRLVNVREILETGNLGFDILVRQYDIIYVPKSQIARADLWVDQYLNKLMPVWIRAHYNLGGTLFNTDPVIDTD
jgi:polysaccharide export outer membrane protein